MPQAPTAGNDQGDQHHDAAVARHGADQCSVAILDRLVDTVEATKEEVALLRRYRHAQPQRALRRLQCGGVDRTDQRGRRDHQRELRVHLTGEAWQEGGRYEHRHQHERDADNRPEQLVHRLDGGVVRRQAPLDMVRHAFHDHDRVVHHDADRQDDGEQSGEVHREAKRRHRGEGADDRHRHGGRRHQGGAPILQEHQDHDEHQDRGLEQRLVDLVDRGIHEPRGVERHAIRQPLRERLRQLGHLGIDQRRHVQRVGRRQLVDRDALPAGLPFSLDDWE